MLFDIHCHANELGDIENIIKKAKEKNVILFFSNSVDLKSCKKNLEMQDKYKEIKALLGLHPSNLLWMNEKERQKTINFIEENIKKSFAIGETGLDFKHAETKEKQEIQRRFFEKQIEIALENNKLIEVHSRQARLDCIEILEKFNARKVLMHWFTAEKELIERIIKNNWFISIGPSILSQKHVQEITKEIPLENLFLETDSPVKFSGKKAEPTMIKEVALKIIEIKDIELKELEKTLEKNLKKIQ